MKWAPRGFGGDRLSPEYFKKHGWHVEGVLVIQVDDDRLTWPERELVRQLAERLYGVKEESNAENTGSAARCQAPARCRPHRARQAVTVGRGKEAALDHDGAA